MDALKWTPLVRKLGNNWSAFKTVRQSFNLVALFCLFLHCMILHLSKNQVYWDELGPNYRAKGPVTGAGTVKESQAPVDCLNIWEALQIIDENSFYLF